MKTENKYLIYEINKIYLNHLTSMLKDDWKFRMDLMNDGTMNFSFYDLKRNKYATIKIQDNVLLDDEYIDVYIGHLHDAKAFPQASLFELMTRKRLLENGFQISKKRIGFNLHTIIY